MQERDRSRRAALQVLLGDVGEVLPYAARANGRAPTPGWYIRVDELKVAATVLAELPEMWVSRDGSLYAGVDTIHAAAMIERIHAIAETQLP